MGVGVRWGLGEMGAEKGEGEDGKSMREWESWDEEGVDVGAGKYIS